MKLNRNYITPLVSLTFLVVGISGLLMLFHWFDGYTEVVHECLGLLFTVSALFHIVVNWKALKIHFKKSVFVPALLAIMVTSVVLIIAEQRYPPVDLQIIQRITKAPVQDAFKALHINPTEAERKLSEKGISLKEAQTLEDLWIQTKADPEEIIDMLLQ